jgi:hypothetical protein
MRHTREAQLQHIARIIPAPVNRNRGDRAFDLHPAVHVMLVGAYLSFVGILATAFMGADLVIPTAIFVIGVVALFATPAMWARTLPEDGARKQSWAEFLQEGVECCTGKLTSNQALAQILILPAMLVSLGAAMVIIKTIL